MIVHPLISDWSISLIHPKMRDTEVVRKTKNIVVLIIDMFGLLTRD